jgi:hypothetical protein
MWALYPLRIAFLSGYNSRDGGRMSRQTERRKQAERVERQRRKAKREARKAARVPRLAAESHRGWLSGRFLTSWFWIKKFATNMSRKAIWSPRK